MSYVDGYVLVVPKAKRAAYKKMAQEGRDMWMKRGALDYKECRLDDAKPKMVKLTFPQLAKARGGEEVWFSFVTYKNKAHRNQVNKAIHKDMEEWGKKMKKSKKEMEAMMPFDMRRMAYGGFVAEVDKK